MLEASRPERPLPAAKGMTNQPHTSQLKKKAQQVDHRVNHGRLSLYLIYELYLSGSFDAD